MKKLIALSILVSILVSAAFAEDGKSSFSITGGADAAVTPLQIVSTEKSDGKGGTKTDTYIGAGVGRPGDPEGPSVSLNAAADFEDKLGAKVDLTFYHNTTYDKGNFGLGDFVEVWLKPVEWFKLDVGKFNEDILRGKVGDDNWAHWTVGMKGKSEIFDRFQGNAGVLAGFTPIKGLYIGVLVPQFAQFTTKDPYLTGSPNDDGQGWRAAQIYKSIQAGVGYEIQGIGLVRAQYVGSRTEVGSWTDTNKDGKIDPKDDQYDGDKDGYTPARIEAAFAFTGMKGLVLDLGLKFWFPYDSYVSNCWDDANDKYIEWGKDKRKDESTEFGSITKPFQVSLGAGYTLGDIGINGRIDARFAGRHTDQTISRKDESDKTILFTGNPKAGETSDPVELNVHLWPSYNLGFAIVGLDFGLEFIGAKTTTTTSTGTLVLGNSSGKAEIEEGSKVRVGFGLWLKKEFGNSSIKLGLAYRLANESETTYTFTPDGGGSMSGSLGKIYEPGVFSIPIVFDYSF